MIKKTLLCFLVFFVALPGSCWAWESERGVFPSPLTADLARGVTVSSINVSVKKETTSVRYIFFNNGEKLTSQVFSIYAKTFSWGGVGSEYPDRHFPEISMTINGKEVSRKKHVRALFDGVDITNALIRAGINPELPGYGEEAIVNENRVRTSESFSELIRMGMLTKADDFGLPNWKLFTSYSWKTRFEPNKSTELVLSYKTRPTYRLLTKLDPIDKGILYSNCAMPDFVDELFSNSSSSYVLSEYKVNFDIEKQNLSEVTVDISGLVSRDSGSFRYFFCDDRGGSQPSDNSNKKILTIRTRSGVFSLVTIEKL